MNSFTIQQLKPNGEVPDFVHNYEVGLGISKVFYYQIVIPAIKIKFNNQCCVCYSTNNLMVHHTSYELQDINHLFLVCKSCHKKIHNEYWRDNEA